jgi:hypothetical protein
MRIDIDEVQIDSGRSAAGAGRGDNRRDNRYDNIGGMPAAISCPETWI